MKMYVDVIIALGYRVQSRDALLPKLMSGELKVENVTF